MKKKLTFLFAVLLSMVSIKSFAHDIEVANSDGKTIYYIYTNNNTELAVSYRGSHSDSYLNEYSGDVVIPESVTYNGITYSVTSIGSSAFDFCYSLTSITIPNGVTSIGGWAFNLCSSLTSVTIPNSVTSIGQSAFYNCISLTSITIPNSVTSIGSLAFYGCSSLTSITIPNGVTSIGQKAFYSCSSLTSINIPNSVTSIGDNAFDHCSSLTSINIPNSVTSIGDNAFDHCSSLTSVTIPNSVTNIGIYAFSNCSSLTSIVVERGNAVYDSRNNCNAIIETSKNTLIAGCKNTIIPNSVTSIGYNAFTGSGLTSITIPNNVTSIDNSAFYGCSSLTSVTIPNSVTSIANDAFQGCTSLTSITIPNSVTKIGWSAFGGCGSLTSITIGSGVTYIDYSAFGYCPELTDVYCYAVNVPYTTNAFDGSKVENATLHVPEESLQAYKETEPWSKFGTIVGLSGGTPETPKCATPTISYDDDNKKLTFGCETEGVEYVYNITDTDIKQGYDAEVCLTATYKISVCATKTGYDNSDVATATLVWGSATFTETTPATAIEMVPAMEAAMPVLIQNNGGMLTVQGAQDGTPISVYTTAGTEAGSAVSQNSRATISTSMQQGDIAIVRIGNRSVKVVLK